MCAWVWAAGYQLFPWPCGGHMAHVADVQRTRFRGAQWEWAVSVLSGVAQCHHGEVGEDCVLAVIVADVHARLAWTCCCQHRYHE
jgi:hypothetical protein